MDEADLLRAYEARAAVLAAYAKSRGIELRKSASKRELEVFSGSATVAFPVVSDPRDWEKMTAEAAFYGAMTDAKCWKNVQLDDVTTATLDTAEQAELPLIKREADAESGRMSALAEMLGGNTDLDALLANVD